MLSQYFGFRENPFGATPDPRFLHQSASHREALASLKYGFYSNRGFTALIAPPGMGKTTLLFTFLEQIRESARSVFIFDTQCEPRELISYILRDLGMVPGRDAVEMHEQLNSVLLAAGHAGQRFVLVIDEAQNLSDAALETVRLLTNFETPRAKLMQIVLAGQPQLSEKLMRPSLLQLRQRVSTVCRIEPLSKEETRAYIGHRLQVAGFEGPELFTKDALNLITEDSHGIPRTINNLCFNALSLCCALNRRRVDADMVVEVIGDLQLTSQPREGLAVYLQTSVEQKHQSERSRQTSWFVKLLVPALAAMLVIAVACVLGVSRYKTHHARPTQTVLLLPSFAAPVAAKIDTAKVIELSSKKLSLEITVEPQQTLSDIAVQNLGSFDHDLLQEIETLNPNMIDPNHIQPGQKIRLPKPQPLPGPQNTTPKDDARNLP